MLFSESIDDIISGIDRLSIWKLREGILIHPLETTLDFFILKYKSNQSSKRELNLAYGLAIVRMVDGFKQSLEDDRFYNSVHLVMEGFELPLVLVNIRHSSTHAQLENLQYLQYAGDIAIQWLKERFWKIQADILQFFELKVLKSIETNSLSIFLRHSLSYVVDILVENIIIKASMSQAEQLVLNLKSNINILPVLIEKIYILILSNSTQEKEKENLKNWFTQLLHYSNEKNLKISEFVIEEILDEHIDLLPEEPDPLFLSDGFSRMFK
eukprot:gene7002-11167_t